MSTAAVVFLALCAAAVGGVAGYLTCMRHCAGDAHADPLAYLESARLSLQCVRWANGDGDGWAVTDGEHKVIGTPQYHPRAAIASAAEYLAANLGDTDV